MSKIVDTESPLVNLEKDVTEFKKEVEEDLKTFSKIDLKSSNKDKAAFKEALNKAIDQLEEHKAECSEISEELNELKKEDEPPEIKPKDFQKRQTNELKKLKELDAKIEKLRKKLKQDLDKQLKEEEKENAKKPKVSEIVEDISKPKGLKELMLDEQAKADERKKLADKEESKADKEKRKKEEKLKLEEEKKKKKEEEKRIKEEKKKPNPIKEDADQSPPDLKSMMATAFDKRKPSKENIENNFDENDDDDEDDEEAEEDVEEVEENVKTENIDEEEVASIHLNSELIKIVREVKIKEEFVETVEGDNYSSPKNLHIINMAKEIRTKEELIYSNELKLNSTQIKPKSLENMHDEHLNEEKSALNNELIEGTKLIVIKDYTPECEGDLEVKKNEIVEFLDYSEDDTAWLEVKNSSGESGFIPSANIEIYHAPQTEESKPSIWKKAKEKIEKKGLQESKALRASGTMPPSFSNSNLPTFELEKYSYEVFLRPQLTESNLNFKNFYWEPKENKLRHKLVAFQKMFLVHKCTNIPIPNKEDLTVLCRTLKICLFDGVSILSNIHTIRAHVGKEEKTWMFEDELSENVSIIDYSEFFIRSDLKNDNLNLGISNSNLLNLLRNYIFALHILIFL